MISTTHARVAVLAKFVGDLANLSKCTDKKIAAIITDTEASQIYSIGVNGGPKGGQDCLCTLGGKYTCAHAEANALAKCTTDCNGKFMICSMSPCIACATLIVNSGISAFYYINEYRDDSGLEILRNAGIIVAQLK